MSDQPLRFLHAADFRLDQPLCGLTEVPEHLRELLIDAPYRAAERALETAVVEGAAVVLLSGALLDPEAPSARAFAFLRNQFLKLQEKGIAVYWASSSRAGVSQWPDGVALPPNVYHFGTAGVTKSSVVIDGVTRSIVLGNSGDGRQLVGSSDYQVEPGSPFSIAMVSGQMNVEAPPPGAIDYWALAGEGNRTTPLGQRPVVHDPGTPQGRRPDHGGPHGCTLVEVDGARNVHLRFVPCDYVRWQHERVAVSPDQPWDTWQATFAERVRDLRALAPGQTLLVTWTLDVIGTSSERPLLAERTEKLVAWLREEFGRQSEPCWTVDVEVDTHRQLPADWLYEDTLLGDYLRTIEQWQESTDPATIDFLPAGHPLIDVLRERADMSDPAFRARLFKQASELGAALLRGEEVGSSP